MRHCGFAVMWLIVCCLTACTSSAVLAIPTATLPAGTATTVPLTPTPQVTLPPAQYVVKTLAHGFGSPDDLVLDSQQRVLFSDFGNNAINLLQADGIKIPLVQNLREPEGLILFPDGSLLVAVQGHNGDHLDAVLHFDHGSMVPKTFVSFQNATNTPGVDGISRDPRTGDILVADSPNGIIYRVSPDGSSKTVIASGFVRPTMAIADRQGAIYIADEYGNAVVRIAADGTKTMIAHLSDPDDLAFDLDGTLLVTVLGDNTVVRLDPLTGHLLGTLGMDLHEPQGLAVDQQGNLYVSEETANLVVELQRLPPFPGP